MYDLPREIVCRIVLLVRKFIKLDKNEETSRKVALNRGRCLYDLFKGTPGNQTHASPAVHTQIKDFAECCKTILLHQDNYGVSVMTNEEFRCQFGDKIAVYSKKIRAGDRDMY